MGETFVKYENKNVVGFSNKFYLNNPTKLYLRKKMFSNKF